MSDAVATSSSTEAEQASDARAVSPKLKFATKTALSLTLAYMLPMAWGWPQPQTAAITVMLIAATGALSESLYKGVLRILGTVAGAVIGLSLIALFPQDRLAYLMAISLVVLVILYLYSCYQGDPTVFMLTLVVSLMVFNGGDAEGAFIYGIDRTTLTLFGVMVYSLVGSLLWPVRSADNCRTLASTFSAHCAATFTDTLAQQSTGSGSEQTAVRESLLDSHSDFRDHYAAVAPGSDDIGAYRAEWEAIGAHYQQLESLLLPLFRPLAGSAPDYERYIEDYQAQLAAIESQFELVDQLWGGVDSPASPPVLPVSYQKERLAEQPHLCRAAVIARLELLNSLKDTLHQLALAIASLNGEHTEFERAVATVTPPSFIWLDAEAAKTAIRGFVTFWLACALWIAFNPPGGFMFVTLCTALVPLVSYTPASPKLLIVLFSFGFVFAVPSYVFLLPQLSHWLELALFLFSYAFIGFFLLGGPVSIFFLLGLFTLGIANDMSYHFDVILTVMLMFYLVCATLVVTVYFPFTSKPERLYCSLRRRFLANAAAMLRSGTPTSARQRALCTTRLRRGDQLLTKLNQWSAQINSRYFTDNPPEQLQAFNHSCENLQGQLKALLASPGRFEDNPLVAAAVSANPNGGVSARLAGALVTGDSFDSDFERDCQQLQDIQHRLDRFISNSDGEAYTEETVADFYLYLNLQAGVAAALVGCRECMVSLNWAQLREPRF